MASAGFVHTKDLDYSGSTAAVLMSPSFRILVITFALFSVLVAGAALPAAADDLDGLVSESNRVYDRGRYKEGIAIAERILSLSRERYGEADPHYAGALNALATFLQLTGSLDRAEQLLRQSLTIDEAALGPDHPETAMRRGNLALVLLDKD
jgi:tetratricopeptide (TPR) repeat protein